jgi:hypothetical protein
MVANVFNSFSLTFAKCLNLQQMGWEDAVPVKFCGIKVTPTTKTDIKSVIYSLIKKKIIRLWWNNKYSF